MAAQKPIEELAGITHGRREQQETDMLWQEPQRKLPNNAALQVGKRVELVHDDGRDGAEVKGRRIQKAIEQDLRNDDQHACVGIDAPVAGHQSDVFRLEAPALCADLHLAEFLLGESDERRRIVGGLLRVQRLE